jgi:hypothetical protein
MLKVVTVLFFFAAIGSMYPIVKLSGGKHRFSHWWIMLPFALIFCYAVCSFFADKLSLNWLIDCGVVSLLIALGLVHLCSMVNSLGSVEIDPSKPIVLPLPK